MDNFTCNKFTAFWKTDSSKSSKTFPPICCKTTNYAEHSKVEHIFIITIPKGPKSPNSDPKCLHVSCNIESCPISTPAYCKKNLSPPPPKKLHWQKFDFHTIPQRLFMFWVMLRCHELADLSHPNEQVILLQRNIYSFKLFIEKAITQLIRGNNSQEKSHKINCS